MVDELLARLRQGERRALAQLLSLAARGRALAEIVPTLIEVVTEEARSFACNAVVVGKHVVTNSGCPRLHADLRSHGYEPIETPLSEFVKAGGSAKCLTLRLDGEEAAAWKYRAEG